MALRAVVCSSFARSAMIVFLCELCVNSAISALNDFLLVLSRHDPRRGEPVTPCCWVDEEDGRIKSGHDGAGRADAMEWAIVVHAVDLRAYLQKMASTSFDLLSSGKMTHPHLVWPERAGSGHHGRPADGQTPDGFTPDGFTPDCLMPDGLMVVGADR
jgi:hypothetical protein